MGTGMFSAVLRNSRGFMLAGVGLLFLSWIFLSCKDDVSGGGTADIVFPAANVSYGKHVQPLFDRGCAMGGCHGPDTFGERGYSLDTYQHATSRVGIILSCFPNEPCNTENSILIRRIEGLDQLPRMPLILPALNANQINGMKQWIREGAQNN